MSLQYRQMVEHLIENGLIQMDAHRSDPGVGRVSLRVDNHLWLTNELMINHMSRESVFGLRINFDGPLRGSFWIVFPFYCHSQIIKYLWGMRVNNDEVIESPVDQQLIALGEAIGRQTLGCLPKLVGQDLSIEVDILKSGLEDQLPELRSAMNGSALRTKVLVDVFEHGTMGEFTIIFGNQMLSQLQNTMDHIAVGLRQPKHKILCVDDEPDILDLLSCFIEEIGFGAVTAATVENAWQQVQLLEDELVLVISDYKMPKYNGNTLRLKMLHGYSHIPFIMLSGFSERLMNLRGINHQVAAVINKPWVDQDFSNLILKLTTTHFWKRDRLIDQ